MFLKCLVGCVVVMLVPLAAIQAADPKQHEGMVVSAGDGKLTMTDASGKQHTHTVPEAAKVTVNGKPGKLADLKPGILVRVMSGSDGTVMAVSTVDDVKCPVPPPGTFAARSAVLLR
jgi:hypothetical protein